MAETHEQRAREIEAQMRGGVYPVQILAASLAEVERETLKCAEIVDDTDIEEYGSGTMMRADDAGATLRSAKAAIRRAFGLEEGAK